MIKNIKSFFLRFYNRLYNKFIYKDCKLLLKFKYLRNIENKSVKFVLVCDSNVDVLNKLRSFEDFKIIDDLRSLVLSGQYCYLGFINEECVFRTLLIKGPVEVEINNSLKMFLSVNQIYIHYSETNVNYRNKKIFQSALSFISLNYCEDYEILIAVDKNNLFSYKAMVRAGFEIVHTLDFKKLFFVFLLNNKILLKNRISIN